MTIQLWVKLYLLSIFLITTVIILGGVFWTLQRSDTVSSEILFGQLIATEFALVSLLTGAISLIFKSILDEVNRKDDAK